MRLVSVPGGSQVGPLRFDVGISQTQLLEAQERTRTRSSRKYCLLPSLGHARVGVTERPSASNVTKLHRSPVVDAFWLACAFKGPLALSSTRRYPPIGWSLMLGVPAHKRTGLACARTT